MLEPSCRDILIVEDDVDACSNLADILEMDEFQVATAGTSAEALAKLRAKEYCAVVIDRRLPDGNADDVLPELKRAAPNASFIVVTGYSDLDGAIAALRQGADDYLIKPLNADALRAGLRRLADQRRLAREKQRSETAFRQLVEAAECLIVLLRADGSLLYLSPFGERVTGFGSEAVGDRSFPDDFLPESERSPFHSALRDAARGEPIRGRETTLLCRDASRRSVIWNLRRLENDEGGPVILLVGQDITELKRAQDQLLRSERLAAIGQMVTGLTHESRNALQRSQACLEMLGLEVRDRPAAIDLIARIQAAQDDLTRLYEDVRSFAAPIVLERRPCRVVETWREAWSSLERQRRAKEGELIERLQIGEDDTIVADPFRLEQVFRNILDNALAAARAPVRVTILAARTRLDDADAVEIRVIDNGPGLDAQQRAKIFETFYTTKTKGTGLGMSISKRIVEAHGGTIAVGDPVERQGAEIIVALPRGNPR